MAVEIHGEQGFAGLAVGETRPLEQIVVEVGLGIRNLKREAARILHERSNGPVAENSRQHSVRAYLRRRVGQRRVEEERLVVP